MGTPQPILSIKNLTKTFGGKAAVSSVNLEIQKGEIFGFLGPNGAGKSTTIRMILDILRPDSGEITIFGISHRDTETVHKQIGYMSGEIVLDLDLTGHQYLGLINNLHGGSFQKNIDRMATLLQAKLDTKIGNYSRGNRQKIALISSLLHEPDLLILDEPTSGFDPLVQATFASLIGEYVKNGGTVFMSSHILSEVQELCDRVAFIRAGKIVEVATISELELKASKQVIITATHTQVGTLKSSAAELQGASNVRLLGTKLSFNYSGQIASLLKYLASQPIADVSIREPELEEIFGEYYIETEGESQS
jgi:ABC-2 type transport system ATP-binding protein